MRNKETIWYARHEGGGNTQRRTNQTSWGKFLSHQTASVVQPGQSCSGGPEQTIDYSLECRNQELTVENAVEIWVPVGQGGLQRVQATRGPATGRLCSPFGGSPGAGGWTGGLQRSCSSGGLISVPRMSGKVTISRSNLQGPSETNFWACDVLALTLSPFCFTFPVYGGARFTPDQKKKKKTCHLLFLIQI